MNQPIHVVDGARTPFLKARNRPGPFAASDLAVQAGRELLLRQRFAPTDLDEVILGCASPSPDEVNIGRVVALRMGCGKKVPGWTVMRNCASGMQAIDSAIAIIRAGRSNLRLAGGVDALSRAPLLYSEKMVLWFARFSTAKSLGEKAAAFLKLNPADALTPIIGIMRGLTDPMVGLLMGQTAENLAFRFGITRVEMDALAALSHQRVLAAQKAGHFMGEIAPLFDTEGNLYEADDGVREDSTPENLAKLKPFFDRKYGNVTAGNSSQITDGAAWLVLASEAAVTRYQLPVLGPILDSESAAALGARCWWKAHERRRAAPRRELRPRVWGQRSGVSRKRGGPSVTDMAPKLNLRHWTIERDADGIAWLVFDKAGTATNTFSVD